MVNSKFKSGHLPVTKYTITTYCPQKKYYKYWSKALPPSTPPGATMQNAIFLAHRPLLRAYTCKFFCVLYTQFLSYNMT